MKLFIAGISYKTTPVAIRERLAVIPDAIGQLAGALRGECGLEEVVLLSTCNRVEIYGVAPQGGWDVRSLFEVLAPGAGAWGHYGYQHEGAETLSHLFAVTSGLDSMVLGETEITGQVKSAYEQARAAGMTRHVLNRVFQTAFRAAKELRSRTHIGRGATSVASVAVELAKRIFGSTLREQAILIAGGGHMAETCGRHLVKHGVQTLVVANRSLERGRALACELGGGALRLEDAVDAMAWTDIVITATGGGTLLWHRDVEALMRLRKHRPLCLIDIAVPRNIDPEVNRLANVYLYDVDDLEAIVRHNVHQRENELAGCRRIIARAVAAQWPRLVGALAGRRIVPARPRDPEILLASPVSAGA